MKKHIAFALLCASFLMTKAQSNELSLSYSPISLYGFEKIVEGTTPDQNNYKVLGAFNLDYYRYMNSWLKLGVSVMYDRASVEGYGSSYYYTPASSSDIPYKSTKQAFVIAPQVDFEYIRRNKLKLSSGLSIGYASEDFSTVGGINSNVNLEGVTFHLNLLSFRWGQKQGLCGSIGVGYKGFANFGYFIRF